jgi:predicted permease
VLAAIGGMAGLALGWAMLRALIAVAPASMTSFQPVAIDGRVIAVTAALTLLTGLVFGLLPMRQITRLQPTDVLRSTDRAVVGRWRLEGRALLVVAQVALGTILLVGAGLMTRSLALVNHVPLGFDPANVLAVSVSLPARVYPTPQARLEFFEQLSSRVASLPGVRSVAFANRLPLRGNWSSGFFFDPAPGLDVPSPAQAGLQAVSPGYFETLGIPLIRGRLLHDRDRSGTDGVAVVSEAFERMLVRRDPIDLRIRRAPEFPTITVVGVVADVRRGGRLADVVPQVYIPAAQTELYPLPLSELAIRYTAGSPPPASALASAVAAIDRHQPLTNVRTFEDTLWLQTGTRRFQTLLFGLFAGVALALAAIGMYGVVAYAIGQRLPEIGLRIALGADRRRVMAWVLGHAARLASGGVAIGLGGAYLLSDLVAAFVFGITPTDPVVYGLAGLVLAAATLTASAVAGRRAIAVDPIVALK